MYCRICKTEKNLEEFYNGQRICKKCDRVNSRARHDRYAVVNAGREIQGDKQCRKCKEVVSVDLFYKNLRMKDGLDSYCIKCRKGLGKGYGRRSKKKRVVLQEIQDGQMNSLNEDDE